MTISAQIAALEILNEILNTTQTAEAVDEWRATLPECERAWVDRAVANAVKTLPNVGEKGAKELVKTVLLYYQQRRSR